MVSDNKLLIGQVALITGGATGIGRAMAEALGKAGARVWVVSRNSRAIETAVRELTAGGVDAKGVTVDVTKRREIEKVVGDILKKDRRIDILLNGAGVMIKHPVLEMPEEVWDQCSR